MEGTTGGIANKIDMSDAAIPEGMLTASCP